MSKRVIIALMTVVGVLVAMMPSLATHADESEPAQFGRVLVFGNSDNGRERNNLGATLTQLGASVDVLPALPESLDGYDSVWNADAYSGLDARVEASLIAFVQAGGSLYLTGERPCCESLNASAERVINALVDGPQVTVGRQGDINGPFTFNPNAIGGVSRFPNVLVDFVPESPGGLRGIGGISDANVFASNATMAVGGVWDEADMTTKQGRLVILMDVDWLTSPARLPIIQNIHSFLSQGAACAALDAHPHLKWPADLPQNCSTLMVVEPMVLDFQVSVASGTVEILVDDRGVDVECVVVSDSPGSVHQRCTVTGATTADATLTVTASSSDFGSTSLFYRVQAKNDPRNVPAGYSLNSNWWEWPDADNDGIPDKWETDGVWTHNGFLNLPGMGADPQRADLFVYAEHQAGFRVSNEVLNHAKEGFRNSPLNDGEGVELHVVQGRDIPTNIVDNMTFVSNRGNEAGLDEDTQNSFQRIATYSGFLSSPYAGGNGVPQIFKWWLNYDRSVAEPDGGVWLGQAVINGNLLWTSVESQWERFDSSASQKARDWTRAVTVVHELGHTLGLGHGGASLEHPDDPKTYRSVMSYAYSTTGVREYRFPFSFKHVDYSRESTVNLDWRFRQAGGGQYGSLVFVQGQLGEHEDFYARSFADWFDFTGEVTAPHDMDEMTREILPSDYEAFAEQFEFTSSLEFPEVDDVDQWNPSEVPQLVLQVRNLDAASAMVLVDVPPAHGRITSTGVGLEYTPTAGFSGEDSVTLRVSNGSLSSEQITIPITVVLEPSVEPTPSPSVSASSSPSAPPSVPVSPAPPPTSSPHTDLYSTPGHHSVNGRQWFTTCEAYSQTQRCRTSIWGTTVDYGKGVYTMTHGWQFNNLTYLPSMKRSQWADNPLGHAGKWTSDEGRRWYTECDTPATGRKGCRSYTWTSFIQSGVDARGARTYKWTQGWVFNNMVRFR